MAGLQTVAEELARKGRFGDSMLLHVNPIEVAGLDALARDMYGTGLTVNPDTGQPEAFLPFLAPLMGALATPMGMGLSGAAIGALTNRDDPLKGALIGGLGGGILGPALGLGSSAAAGAAGAAGNTAAQAATQQAVQQGANQALQQGAKTALEQGIQTGMNAGGSMAGASTPAVTAPTAIAAPTPPPMIAAPTPGVDPMSAINSMQMPTTGNMTMSEMSGRGVASSMPPPAPQAVTPPPPQPMKPMMDTPIIGTGGGTPTGGFQQMSQPPGVASSPSPALKTPAPVSTPKNMMVDGAVKPFERVTHGPESLMDKMGKGIGGILNDPMKMIQYGLLGSIAENYIKSGDKDDDDAEKKKTRQKYEGRIRDNYTAAGRTPPFQFADGGLAMGPGDGRSDSIPAMIDGAQPAEISTGEFVFPADVVSAIGRGSTEAGAARLEELMMNIRANRDKLLGGKGKK